MEFNITRFKAESQRIDKVAIHEKLSFFLIVDSCIRYFFLNYIYKLLIVHSSRSR